MLLTIVNVFMSPILLAMVVSANEMDFCNSATWRPPKASRGSQSGSSYLGDRSDDRERRPPRAVDLDKGRGVLERDGTGGMPNRPS